MQSEGKTSMLYSVDSTPEYYRRAAQKLGYLSKPTITYGYYR